MKYVVTVIAVLINLFTGVHVDAAPSPSVVISQLQVGPPGLATQEFVELYNNSASDIDVTDWCVTYGAAADTAAPSVVGCIKTQDPATRLWLKAGGYATLSAPDFQAANGYVGDVTFTHLNGIASSGGHIRLLDGAKNEIDKLGWGTAAHPESAVMSAPTGGKVLQRKSLGASQLQDTDNNSNDFIAVMMQLHTSGLFEIVTIIDVCPNIDGPQATVPSGQIIDAQGNCISPPVDVCPNLEGIQAAMPDGYLHDGNGECKIDACVNLDGLQTIIPDGYESHDGFTCTLIPLVSDIVEITELLPNPLGTDTGNEFIELYNPNAHAVNLTGYRLLLGANLDKEYAVPPEYAVLGPGQYVAFGNLGIGFTLVNTSSRARLIAPAGNTVSDVPAYSNPADGESWASIAGGWQYTNRPTAGESNLVYLDDEPVESSVSSSGVSACAAGKYRHPLTNRCRNIESDASVLATCDSDQYRNPETGRCRKVVLAGGLTPCKDGQYRSEETNRCRNISSASTDLAPCKEGQQRSSETNRCRNVTSSSVPAAAFAVEPTKQGLASFVGWWALGGIAILALGYGIWEWRVELMAFARRIAPFTRGK